MSAATPLPNESRSKSGSCGKWNLLLPSLLFPAGAHQDARHAVVPFVTGGIEDHVALIGGPPHFNDNSPGLRPGLGIVEGDFAPQSVRVGSREAFDHLVCLYVGSPKALRKVRCFDDQRISFPMAT